MAMFIFTNKILAGKPIPVFNNGNMKRDFTYINGIISGTRGAIDKNYECDVFNLGNHKSEQLVDVISLIEGNLGKKVEINFLPIQPDDIPESFADIDKSIDMLDYKPTANVGIGIEELITWYKEFYKC
jgi:UDP-glucuronate 4-epimerase